MDFIIIVIDMLIRLITILVIVNVFLSYFLSPYHPIRENLDRIINPLLNPIRRLLPQTGMIDFSPFILLVLVQVVGQILIALLRSM